MPADALGPLHFSPPQEQEVGIGLFIEVVPVDDMAAMLGDAEGLPLLPGLPVVVGENQVFPSEVARCPSSSARTLSRTLPSRRPLWVET